MNPVPQRDMPRVTVLLAAYNGQEWLPAQLASILAQEQVQVNVYISLDLSTDASERWLGNEVDKESRLHLLPTGARFGSAARNFYRLLRDVDLENADVVALSDQDDVWNVDRLARACDVMNRGFSGYSSDVDAFWPDGHRCVLRKSQPQRRWDFLFESAGPGCTFVLSGTLARALQSWLREHWDAIHQVRHHDWLIYAFARSRHFPWMIDSYPGVSYRQHDDNELGARVGLTGIWRRTQKVWHGEGFAQARKIALLVGLAEDPFVREWYAGRRQGFLRLALAAPQCRRRYLDRWLFACLCMKAWLVGD